MPANNHARANKKSCDGYIRLVSFDNATVQVLLIVFKSFHEHEQQRTNAAQRSGAPSSTDFTVAKSQEYSGAWGRTNHIPQNLKQVRTRTCYVRSHDHALSVKIAMLPTLPWYTAGPMSSSWCCRWNTIHDACPQNPNASPPDVICHASAPLSWEKGQWINGIMSKEVQNERRMRKGYKKCIISGHEKR